MHHDINTNAHIYLHGNAMSVCLTHNNSYTFISCVSQTEINFYTLTTLLQICTNTFFAMQCLIC